MYDDFRSAFLCVNRFAEPKKIIWEANYEKGSKHCTFFGYVPWLAGILRLFQRKQHSNVRQRHRSLSLIHIFCALLGFLYLPIAILIAFSFNESKSRAVFTGFTFKWYVNLFHDEMVLKSLLVSLIIAFAASILATLLGTMASIGISSMKKRTRSAIMTVSYIPVINPEIITGVSLMLLFVVGNDGMSKILSTILDKEVAVQGFGMVTLLLAHITFCVPYVV